MFEHSLLLVFGTIFLLSWAAQAVTGWVTFNEEQLRQLQQTETFSSYLGGADFWSRTLENWQSEFLAVGTMSVYSIWLRERGSPESKAVGAPHAKTGSDV